jgi:hypothetical protein
LSNILSRIFLAPFLFQIRCKKSAHFACLTISSANFNLCQEKDLFNCHAQANHKGNNHHIKLLANASVYGMSIS